MNSVFLWDNQDIRELDKYELLKVIERLWKELQREKDLHKGSLEILSAVSKSL